MYKRQGIEFADEASGGGITKIGESLGGGLTGGGSYQMGRFGGQDTFPMHLQNRARVT